VRLSAGDKPIDTSLLQFNLIDSLGSRYTPVVFNTAFSNNAALTGQLVQPKTEVLGTVGFLVPRTIPPSAQFNVTVAPGGQTIAYRLIYNTPQVLTQLAAQVSISKVEIRRSSGKPDRVFVRLTISNPNDPPLAVHQSDFYAIYSVSDPGTTFPVGARVAPFSVNGSAQLEANIEPQQGLLVEAEFDWDKSPYVGLFILGYQFIVKLT
jgi:hypothetical protein